MRAKLLFPPKWSYSQPYLSLPSLTAVLREKGIQVEQYDLNLESIYFMLEANRLQAKANQVISEHLIENLPETEQKEFGEILELQDFIIDNLPATLQALKSLTNFADYRIDKLNRYIMDQALALYSLPSDPEKVQHNLYKSKYNCYSSEEIIAAIEHPEDNLYYEFFCERVPELVEDTDFIGISITGVIQIIPGMVLAGMLKAAKPDLHICIGGPVFTAWSDRLETVKKFFPYIDSIVLYEGEIPLLKLIEALDTGQELDAVPNLLYCTNGEIHMTNLISPPHFNELPVPDFQGLPLDDYLTPALVLPLLASRGCYWRRCTFCSHSHIYGGRYDMRSTEKLMSDFREITNKYGAKYINFADESVSPRLLQNISEAILNSGLEIYWSCDMRFEKSLTGELMDEAYQAGLRIFYFGLESYNDRVRGLMDKGTEKEIIQRILKDGYERDIHNHLFFIAGFPTETWSELQETIQFLKENKHYITSGAADFSLQRHSPIETQPEQYKIQFLPTKNDLTLIHEFVCSEGMKREEVLNFLNQLDMAQISNVSFARYAKFVHRDHWVIYAAHNPLYKLENYVQTTLPPFDPEMPLELFQGIHYTIAEDGNTIIYDLITPAKHTTTGDTSLLLNLFKTGPLTTLECCDKLAPLFNCSPDILVPQIEPFVESLYNLRLLKPTKESKL